MEGFTLLLDSRKRKEKTEARQKCELFPQSFTLQLSGNSTPGTYHLHNAPKCRWKSFLKIESMQQHVYSDTAAQHKEPFDFSEFRKQFQQKSIWRSYPTPDTWHTDVITSLLESVIRKKRKEKNITHGLKKL